MAAIWSLAALPSTMHRPSDAVVPLGQSDAVFAWTYHPDEPSLPAGEYWHTTISPPEQLAVAHPTLVVVAHSTCEYEL